MKDASSSASGSFFFLKPAPNAQCRSFFAFSLAFLVGITVGLTTSQHDPDNTSISYSQLQPSLSDPPSKLLIMLRRHPCRFNHCPPQNTRTPPNYSTTILHIVRLMNPRRQTIPENKFLVVGKPRYRTIFRPDQQCRVHVNTGQAKQ
jgi:hypothetical protein